MNRLSVWAGLGLYRLDINEISLCRDKLGLSCKEHCCMMTVPECQTCTGILKNFEISHDCCVGIVQDYCDVFKCIAIQVNSSLFGTSEGVRMPRYLLSRKLQWVVTFGLLAPEALHWLALKVI